MNMYQKNGLVWFDSEAAQVPGIEYRFFGRTGGVSKEPYASLNGRLGQGELATHVEENKRRVAEAMGAQDIVLATQVHGTKALWVEAENDDIGEADALMTQAKGLVIAVKTADCVPIVVMAENGQWCAVIHAGWRGACQGIIAETLTAFKKRVSGALMAVIGPSIRAESYQVGSDVYEGFIGHKNRDMFLRPNPNNKGKFFLDLPGFCAYQLKAYGAMRAVDVGLNTYTEADRFFSCRRAAHQGQGAQFGCQFSAVKIEE
ncbi:MAG: hypothetical protein CMM87_04350 [Rickettsiales bacterium]|nr:hypothetical protein [Rickettsiales bacterium]|tara:strand:- start:1752 stop:2531 length:780 start_codon:yes stop_codon:yes gene_type:complete